MASLPAMEFLEDLITKYPELAEEITTLSQLHESKLWHPLTVKIEACYNNEQFNVGDLPYQLFVNFTLTFGHKINLLKLAQFAVHASKYLPNAAASVDFLNMVLTKLEEMKLPRTAEPMLFIRMHVAQYKLESSGPAEAKTLVEEGVEKVTTMSNVDPSVSAAVYYVASLYHKAAGMYADYYRTALTYLSYVSSDSLPADFKQRLAVDIALAALLGEHVYSFGQLLQHPIVGSLEGGSYAWLGDLLRAFNDGDMHRYDELCVRYAAQLNAQPALVASERRLREKITLMCLVEMVSGLPAEQRRIALADVAARTKLSVDGVEFLLMKALALHLIEGSIDQVDGSVQVSWVQPRILTKPQIQGLKERLDGWIGRVTAITATLEQETVGVVEA